MPTLGISSTFICEPLTDALAFWINQLNLNMDYLFRPYNQVIQSLIDRQNRAEIEMLILRLEDWYVPEQHENLRQNINVLSQALLSASKESSSLFFILICPYSGRLSAEEVLLFLALEEHLKISLINQPNIDVVDSKQLLVQYPVIDKHNNYGLELGHIPYSDDFYIALGTVIARKIVALRFNCYKVVVLDCDYTLWDGVCGEVGALGVQVADGYSYLQNVMKLQHEQGMLLCLCSKNDEQDVFEVFSHNQEMILHKCHITAHRINWHKKSDNLRSLAQELSLGLEAFIFIDDNPIECMEVRNALPQVLVLQLPKHQRFIREFLHHCWFLDKIKVTEEDRLRPKYYQENSRRNALKQSTQSLVSFVESLNLQLEFAQLNLNDVIRVSQLTQRTNQFNTTTIRYVEQDLLSLKLNNTECYSVRVKDNFGDYGLVGVLIVKKQENALVVENFLLSCRVLGRGVEHKMVAWLGQLALKENFNSLYFNYETTRRNKPVLLFLQSLASTSKVLNPFKVDAGVASSLTFNPEAMPYYEAIQNSADLRNNNNPQSHGNISIIQHTAELNSVHKIKKAIFKNFSLSRKAVASCYSEPITDNEKKIIEIWQDHFKISALGISDNFFDLGGNSVLAAQILSDVFDVFGVAMTITDILTHPQIKDFLKLITSSANYSTKANLPNNREEKLTPLSFAQLSIYFLAQFIANKKTYNVPVTLRIEGKLLPDLLQKSLNKILVRHAILRSRVKEIDGELFLDELCPQPLTFPMNYHDASAALDTIHSIIQLETNRSFDLHTWPLMHSVLIKEHDTSYIFSLIFHHVIIDAGSIDIFLNELAQGYTDLKQSKKCSLSNLSAQYSDFSIQQHHQLANGTWDTSAAFWQTWLADAPYLELPLDKSRSPLQSHEGAYCSVWLDRPITEQIRFLAKENQATLFTVLLSMLQVLLYRLTGQNDFVIGIPVHDQYQQSTKVMGLFVNTLPLRCQVSIDDSFIQLLTKTKQQLITAYAHQDVPFEKIIEALSLKRNATKNPLFPLMFVHRQQRLIKEAMDNLQLHCLSAETNTSLFDLSLITEETPLSICLGFEYARDLFYESTVQQMLAYFKGLILTLVENPLGRIDDSMRFNQDAELQLLSSVNQTKKTLPVYETLHEWFHHQALLTPDGIALSDGHKQLTYKELDECSTRFAFQIKAIFPNEAQLLIPICMDASIEYIISLLAVLKAGWAYVPIDPELPDERIRWMLIDSKALMLISSTQYLDRFVFFNGVLIPYTGDELTVNANPTHLQAKTTAPSLAYVMYTSGSTGKPKGVMIGHQSVCNFVHSQMNILNLNALSKTVLLASISFDPSVHEWASSLLSGATLHILPPKTKYNPDATIEFCKKLKITHLIMTPSYLSLLPETDLPDLQVLVIGGELCDEHLLKKWQSKVPVLINAYGPTETSIYSSFFHYTEAASPSIIGQPIDNTQFYILDDFKQHVPIGIPGELYIGGLGLARGYLNNDELTKERFVQTSFGLLYKTGDRARLLTNGNFEYLGRLDSQIKIRGHRVDVMEIESVLLQDYHIQQAVVIVRGSDSSNQQLIAFISLSSPDCDEQTLLTRLHTHLEKNLPVYMRPAGFVIFDQLPVLSGKVDRKKLATMDCRVQFEQKNYTPPGNSIESDLIKLFQQLITLEKIGINDDFFNLGGNSLLAVSLTRNINKKWGVSLSLYEVYSKPTIYELGLLIQRHLKGLSTISPHELITRALFPIQTKGSHPALFIVHSSLGLASPYLGLASYIDHRPVYGLNNPYFGEQHTGFKTIQAMAHFYMKVIQSVQSAGPYVISGWSFGGIVGLEIARELQKAGELVEQVILIDSYHPSQVKEVHFDNKSFLIKQGINPESPEGLMYQDEINNNLKLLKDYQVEEYRGKVILLKAKSARWGDLHSNGWEDVIKSGIEVLHIAGAHHELFDESHIKNTAKCFRAIHSQSSSYQGEGL